jgi:hypothetical protein
MEQEPAHELLTRHRLGCPAISSITLQEERASRQTELQRELPLHMVCSWLGNSPRIAQQSCLLVTEDDFARAAWAKKVMV